MIGFKLIYECVPKWLRWLILAGLVSPVLRYIPLQFLKDEPIGIVQANLLWYLAVIGALVILGLVLGSIKALRRMQQIHPRGEHNKVLPDRRVSIGTYCSSNLCVDVQADIVLGENARPSPDVFLRRIHPGDPYCSVCQGTARVKRASWLADGRPIGYECRECGWVENLAPPDLSHNVDGFVRKNFRSLWETYSSTIVELTDGHPDDYVVPGH